MLRWLWVAVTVLFIFGPSTHCSSLCHLEIEVNPDTAYIETLKTLKLPIIEWHLICTPNMFCMDIWLLGETHVSSVGYVCYLVSFQMDWKWIWWFWWLILVLSDHEQWHCTIQCKRHCICFPDIAYVPIEDTICSYCKYRVNVYVLKNIRNRLIWVILLSFKKCINTL